MDAGEGIRIVAIFGAVASVGGLLLIGAARKWKREIDHWPEEPSDGGEDSYRDNLAAALVPEYAAARLLGERTRGCGCQACRHRRDQQPCSDFDGD